MICGLTLWVLNFGYVYGYFGCIVATYAGFAAEQTLYRVLYGYFVEIFQQISRKEWLFAYQVQYLYGKLIF